MSDTFWTLVAVIMFVLFMVAMCLFLNRPHVDSKGVVHHVEATD